MRRTGREWLRTYKNPPGSDSTNPQLLGFIAVSLILAAILASMMHLARREQRTRRTIATRIVAANTMAAGARGRKASGARPGRSEARTAARNRHE